MTPRAGVVGVQGDVPEHRRGLELAFGGMEAVAVREPTEVERCDLLVLPGGESTTISRLLTEWNLREPIRAHVAAEKPLLATCAGIIIAATEPNDKRIEPLSLLDVCIDRNAYGRQRESFEAPIDVTGLEEPFPGVFIRAPRIEAVGNARVLARYDGEPVAVAQGPVVGATFHPELPGDPRFHRAALATGSAVPE